MHIFDVYNLMGLDIRIHSWNDHHSQDNRHISITSTTLLGSRWFWMCVWEWGGVITHYMSSTILNYQVYQHSVVNYRHNIAQQISRTYSSFQHSFYTAVSFHTFHIKLGNFLSLLGTLTLAEKRLVRSFPGLFTRTYYRCEKSADPFSFRLSEN